MHVVLLPITIMLGLRKHSTDLFLQYKKKPLTKVGGFFDVLEIFAIASNDLFEPVERVFTAPFERTVTVIILVDVDEAVAF